MEQARLTIRVDRDLLDAAKRYAREHNTTLMRLGSEYLRRLGSRDGVPFEAPIADW